MFSYDTIQYVTPTCTFPSCEPWHLQSTSLSPACPRVILSGDVCSLFGEHEPQLSPETCHNITFLQKLL